MTISEYTTLKYYVNTLKTTEKDALNRNETTDLQKKSIQKIFLDLLVQIILPKNPFYIIMNQVY